MVAVLIDRQPQPKRKSRRARADEHPRYLPRDKMVNRVHGAGELGDRGSREARLLDRGRSRPHQGAAERRREREPAERPSGAAAAERETGDRQRGAKTQDRLPLPRVAECEPGGDPASEADGEPRRKLGALRLEELLQPLPGRGKPRLPIAPSTLWKRRFPYVRGARPLHCSIS